MTIANVCSILQGFPACPLVAELITNGVSRVVGVTKMGRILPRAGIDIRASGLGIVPPRLPFVTLLTTPTCLCGSFCDTTRVASNVHNTIRDSHHEPTLWWQ